MPNVFLKVLLTLFVVFGLSVCIFAQTTAIKKATKSYNNYNYSDVVNRLEEKKIEQFDAIRKLADSYKMSGDYKKAKDSYQKLITSKGISLEDLFWYYHILQMNEKYNEAIQEMELISEFNNTDKRVQLYNSNKNYLKDLLTNKEQFKIKNLAINSKEQDFGATYFKNQIVYTSSKRGLGPVYRTWNGNKLPYLDLYYANTDNNNELVTGSKLNQLNKKYHEGPASFSKDSKVMIYNCNNYKAKSKDHVRKLQLFECTLDGEGKWTESISFPYNNNEYSCGHPALSSDGNTLYFSSDMPGGKGGVDIYRTTRSSNGKWEKPENMSEINTEGNEMFPFIHESGLFFFSSDGRPGIGGLDIFVTKITPVFSYSFQVGNIINVGVPVNSSKDDLSMVLNANQDKGFFASNREGGKGDDDIYSFDLLKPFVFSKTIKGVTKDKEGNILANTKVNLYDDNGNILATVLSAIDGSFLFNDLQANKNFSLLGTKKNYIEAKNALSTNVVEDIIVSDLELDTEPSFSLYALITDYETKKPLQGVNIKITDEKNKMLEIITPESGDYTAAILNKKLGDSIKYTFELQKQGYVSKTVNFNKLLIKPGAQKVNEELDLSLGKMEVGKDIGKLVNINPIYFDVNKSSIRTDAAVELDKIVEVMNEYPQMVIELGSHTDCRASSAYNMSLSDQRAKASAAYIISKGISKDRIYGKGYGESKLINGCACEGTVKSTCSEEEHQANRRTEFIIVRLKG